MLIAAAAFAAPSLTTIQDVLYKADGNKFNGTVTIAWSSFQAADHSAIVTQSTTVKVVDGFLRVQLVPTTTATPASQYQVTYNSDGRIQFTEIWAVPASATPLRVQDVRTTAAPSQDTATQPGTTAQESDVVGLVADLSARPIKGPGFAPGRVAMVNASGALESISGVLSDCVRVDGTAGPCGAQPPAFVDGEALSGIVDGSNASFTLADLPEPASSLAIYRNGLLQKASLDYTSTGRTILFGTESVPQPGDILLASYRISGSEDDSPAGFAPSQVLCAGSGGSTGALTLTSIGSCVIPAATIQPGDRFEIRFDLENQGSAGAFSFEVRWGSTVILHRDASAADALATGRADASIKSSGAQLSSQSWGTALPFAANVALAADSYSSGIIVDFQGKVAQAGGTVALRNYSVVRVR
jgi:hypothetical protein